MTRLLRITLSMCLLCSPVLAQTTYDDLLADFERKQAQTKEAENLFDEGKYDQGLSKLRRFSAEGNEFAQHSMCLFPFSSSTPEERRDYKEGVKYCRKLAMKGFPVPQNIMARAHLNGYGVEQSDTEAAYWFKQAANGNDPQSQHLIGTLYVLGKGVPRDFVLGYHWINLAASQGYADAIKMRETLAGMLTPSQIDEANRITREFKPRH